MGNPNAPYRPGEWASLRDMEIVGATLAQRARQQKYGAIVYSPSTRRHGYSFNCSSADEAATLARNQCGAPDAGVVAQGHNFYLALALADGGAYGAGWAADPKSAAQYALANCSGPNPHLTIVVDTGSGAVPMNGAVPANGAVPMNGAVPARVKRFQPEDYRVAFLWGVPGGLAAALAVGLAVVLTNASGRPSASGTNPVIVACIYLGGFLCLLCGALAARKTGRARTGVLAAQPVAVLWALALLLSMFYDSGGTQQLQRAPSQSDIAPSVGAALIFLILGVFVGMALGALGGLVGRKWRPRS
jgi:hypothetical protein